VFSLHGPPLSDATVHGSFALCVRHGEAGRLVGGASYPITDWQVATVCGVGCGVATHGMVAVRQLTVLRPWHRWCRRRTGAATADREFEIGKREKGPHRWRAWRAD
jgi:hypothetical protein